jgi:hypothetical protein
MVSVEKFNKTLTELFNNIKSNYSYLEESINTNYEFPLTGKNYIEKFCMYSKDKEQDISTKNEMIFCENRILIEHIDFYRLWNDETFDCDNKETIWNYLHTLYIYAYEYKNNKEVTTILDELKDIPLDSDELDLKTKAFLNIIESLKNKVDITTTDTGIDEILEDSNIEIPEIFEGSIGKLANEIAKDIDTDNLNIDDPSKLLEGLFSGNLDINNDTSGIANLVQNITSKIQDKISSGELNENDLFNEANNVMNKLNQNNMFSNIINTMNQSSTSENSDLNQQAHLQITENNKYLDKTKSGITIEQKQKLQEKRDYLKKKLETKKLEEKKLEEKKWEENK